jgi:hypothetical protein
MSKSSAELPDPATRLPCRRVVAPHPATVPVEELLKQCELRTQRRSGPGGQHRNKTSTGAFLTHRPTGVVGEATESRSQSTNRDVALQRLRFLLALEVRTTSPLEGSLVNRSDSAPSFLGEDSCEAAVRKRYRRHPLKLAETNADKPALLALVLNDVWVAGGQPSLVTPLWSVSTSKLVAFLRSHPAALRWVNQVRSHHGRLPLH